MKDLGTGSELGVECHEMVAKCLKIFVLTDRQVTSSLLLTVHSNVAGHIERLNVWDDLCRHVLSECYWKKSLTLIGKLQPLNKSERFVLHLHIQQLE